MIYLCARDRRDGWTATLTPRRSRDGGWPTVGDGGGGDGDDGEAAGPIVRFW